MITTMHEPVFLGVVVNPKTKAPVFVVKRAHTERTIDIFAAVPEFERGALYTYKEVGQAYLNEDIDYAGPTEVTGYPRSHTPSGVTEHGAGYGTALYTGLVLLATADFDGEVKLPGLRGHGAGICSTPSDGTRSKAADAWWQAAVRRGLADRTAGFTEDHEPETETREDSGPLSEFVSRASFRRVMDAIENAIAETEWSLDDAEVRVEVRREVELEESGRASETITVDVYTLANAEHHNLIAVRDVQRGSFLSWAANAKPDGVADRNVILALNIAREDIRVVGKLALCARAAGATEGEVTAFLMRHRFGADVVSRRVLFEEPVVPVATPVRVSPRTRIPPRMSERRGVGLAAPAPNPPLDIKRNPAPAPSAADLRMLEKHLAELEKRRADLGWADLEDL